MAILRSCCCGYSVRSGSYASAVYTLIYFFLFALLTGNYSYHEVMSRFTGKTPDNLTEAEFQNASSSLDEKTSQNNLTNGDTLYEVQQKSTGELAIILVDFVSEIAGFLVSIVLIRGLQQEKKSYLIPWLIIIPLHTAIDAFTVINIVIVYAKSTESENRDFVWGCVTIVTVVLDLVLNLINVYVFLCVISQYQEYRAGRGTAAYEGLIWQQGPVSVHYESGNSGSRSGNGDSRAQLNKYNGRSNGNNPCFTTDNERSNIWCEDLVLDKLDRSSPHKAHQSHSKPNSPQVRFECEDSNGKCRRKSAPGRHRGGKTKSLKASPPSGRSAEDISDTTTTMAAMETTDP